MSDLTKIDEVKEWLAGWLSYRSLRIAELNITRTAREQRANYEECVRDMRWPTHALREYRESVEFLEHAAKTHTLENRLKKCTKKELIAMLAADRISRFSALYAGYEDCAVYFWKREKGHDRTKDELVCACLAHELEPKGAK